MTRKDLANLVYAWAQANLPVPDDATRRVAVTKDEAMVIVRIVIDEFAVNLVMGKKVMIEGFGSFRVVHRKARPARNPKTGEGVTVPPRWVVTFKPAPTLLAALQQRPKTRQAAEAAL